MVYLGLNIIASIFLIIYTRYIDKKLRVDYYETNSFIVCLLIATIESFGYTLVLIANNTAFASAVPQIMKVLLVLEGFFFINLSFGLLALGMNIKRFIIQVIKYALLAFVIYIVYAKFTGIEVSTDKGILIISEYLFSGEAREFFPWTWVTLYQAAIKCFLPGACWVFLLVIQENKNVNQLQKYQSILIGESLVVMWGTSLLITYISKVSPGFSLLFVYSYLFMFVLLFGAITKTSVPSKKGIAVSILKVIITYFLPAFVIGGVCTVLQPDEGFSFGFISLLVIVSIVVTLFALRISDFLTSNTKLYTADYEDKLEKDLASIDYSAEMDAITTRMNEILRRNIETTSLNVYIDGGKGVMDVAYSSNNMTNGIPVNNPIFDTLLNVNKSVVVYSELEKEHSVSSIKQDLYKFFEDTKSDALLLLNEGHNLLGVITLGNKAGGDHYKDYDYNVFVKLYSYFFVFGYYMRNISNKEIISVVKREIKMSSQIITSIQENIDIVNNPKVDIGYLMVPAHNIGGEFIDMIRLTDTRHLFVVGDLSGKGIAASMNMVILKSIIRTYLAETHDFKQLVVKVNSFIRDSLRKGTIFAGLFALVDFETDTMYYINCGIPALMLYTQVYNNVIEIQGSGHVLGFVKDISPYIAVKTTKLNSGDVILACTDGMIQSHSLRGEQFGKERVQQAMLDNSTYPAQRMVQFSFDALLKFMSKEMEDDVSLLVLKYGETKKNQDEGSVNSTEEVTENKSEVENEEASSAEVKTESPEAEAAADADDIPQIDEAAIAAAMAEAQAMDEGTPSQNEEKSDSGENTETPVENKTEEDANASEPTAGGFELPEDADLPEGFDLGNIDAMMKMAGL